MRDNGVSVLEQYDFEVRGTRKVRGAVLCDTDQGLMLLKEAGRMKGGVSLLYGLQQMLAEKGYENIDLLHPNKEGELISANEDGERYLVKRWPAGRECDIRSEAEVQKSARNLAVLHRLMAVNDPEGMKKGRELPEVYSRHNRELKKIRSFMRKKPDKGKFETIYLREFENMFAAAEGAAAKLEESSCRQLVRKARREGTVCHGDYNYHNILIGGRGAATVNFEHYFLGVQMDDLYYFLRKTLEKYNWREKICEEILEEYSREKEIGAGELEYLAVRLGYPEKFWKTANAYYCTNKAWISEKNAQKLEICISQQEKKKKLLKDIFSFHL